MKSAISFISDAEKSKLLFMLHDINSVWLLQFQLCNFFPGEPPSRVHEINRMISLKKSLKKTISHVHSIGMRSIPMSNIANRLIIPTPITCKLSRGRNIIQSRQPRRTTLSFQIKYSSKERQLLQTKFNVLHLGGTEQLTY